uniref:TauD/TfdA-like domain-containing protein n=1 Tax=Chromera velia CCMP2878 TaxID=1169474 RepID=A0A0G4GRP7_9ALVE|eukprot:Cvel_23095.t1-p1 / transcript=Cvel_23095.t1 / gene=Cvel_23095 / organism=Chromera_velia_CCMP2878 / gene_product=Zinc transporter ZupT, putative / transcript_product=Zinc transporter ZupT, putative / location=Cvel_scaffold2342:4267-11170(-) / protein_length=881 / sequence_SO=supercontig / SO=protein_coding / is_pseudo=false
MRFQGCTEKYRGLRVAARLLSLSLSLSVSISVPERETVRPPTEERLPSHGHSNTSAPISVGPSEVLTSIDGLSFRTQPFCSESEARDPQTRGLQVDSGLDLLKDTDSKRVVEGLKALTSEHGFLVIRNQLNPDGSPLSEEQLETVGQRFGKLNPQKPVHKANTGKKVTRISNDPELGNQQVGVLWHIEYICTASVQRYLILYAAAANDRTTPTQISPTAAAVENLSDSQYEFLRRLYIQVEPEEGGLRPTLIEHEHTGRPVVVSRLYDLLSEDHPAARKSATHGCARRPLSKDRFMFFLGEIPQEGGTPVKYWNFREIKRMRETGELVELSREETGTVAAFLYDLFEANSVKLRWATRPGDFLLIDNFASVHQVASEAIQSVEEIGLRLLFKLYVIDQEGVPKGERKAYFVAPSRVKSSSESADGFSGRQILDRCLGVKARTGEEIQSLAESDLNSNPGVSISECMRYKGGGNGQADGEETASVSLWGSQGHGHEETSRLLFVGECWPKEAVLGAQDENNPLPVETMAKQLLAAARVRALHGVGDISDHSISEANIGIAFGFVIIAAASTAVGGGIALLVDRRFDRRVLACGLGVAAGVMIAVSLGELLTETIHGFEDAGWDAAVSLTLAYLCVFSGVVIGKLCDMLVHYLLPGGAHKHEDTSHEPSGPQDKTPQEQNENADQTPQSHADEESPTAAGGTDEARMVKGKEARQEMKRLSFATFIALTLHNMPEGVAVFVAALFDTQLGIVIAIAIALHNIPEGFAVAIPYLAGTGKRLQALGWAALSGVAELVGGCIGALVIFVTNRDLQLSSSGFAVCFGLTAGVMLFVAFAELAPAAYTYDSGRFWAHFSILLGIAVMALSDIILAAVEGGEEEEHAHE